MFSAIQILRRCDALFSTKAFFTFTFHRINSPSVVVLLLLLLLLINQRFSSEKCYNIGGGRERLKTEREREGEREIKEREETLKVLLFLSQPFSPFDIQVRVWQTMEMKVAPITKT